MRRVVSSQSSCWRTISASARQASTIFFGARGLPSLLVVTVTGEAVRSSSAWICAAVSFRSRSSNSATMPLTMALDKDTPER